MNHPDKHIPAPAGQERILKITAARSAVEEEALLRPFGFKGSHLSRLWQTAVQLKSDNGHTAVGLGVQSVLWSDPEVCAAHSETAGNTLMYDITRKALELLEGISFTHPMELLDTIFDTLYAYGQRITGRTDLRRTFVLNALVPVDNAAWLLYARENNLTGFDAMVPGSCRPALSARNSRIAAVPVVGYDTPDDTLLALLDEGHFFLKIKMGHPGAPADMLEKDKARISQIHRLAGTRDTPETPDGKIRYYLDANGRYPNKDLLRQLLDHVSAIGALEQVALLEEPFPEHYEAGVSDLGVRIAADESAHTDTDLAARIRMGYGAVALKAIAKTLSMTLKMAGLAHREGLPCFCADLTVNPVLVEWNKNVAARLAPFPGLQTSLLEANGHQHYKDWDRLCSYNPAKDASWTEARQGSFALDEQYYRESGGIFKRSEHYENLFSR
ncbi:enolase C-terminal domain-like protein [Compostibacter hankyongensis]|uniref:Enolase C-terminal domain-containing protein n=1 Tax=Compostibacter hankyongensis TaxID=1007089 RepID=A0ABP8G9K1_9BACT